MRQRRNPFARETYIPVRDTERAHLCTWCGQSAHPRYPLYHIKMESDAGRQSWLAGVFDSWSCAESYHGRIGR